MSVQINISGTIIEFPSSAQSPNWAPALIEFAQTVESALSGIVGPYDISPQVIDIVNTGLETAIQNASVSLSFPTSTVRAANIRYSVYRSNSVPYTHSETGLLTVVYNANAAIGYKWQIQRDFVGNITPEGTSGNGLTTAGINFRIDDNGQLYYTAVSINSTGYTGKLSFAAQALTQS